MALSDTLNMNKGGPSSFALVFPVIPGRIKPDEFILNVHGCNLPGVELGSKDLRWQGGVTHIPDAVSSWAALTVNFVVDEDLTNWTTIFNWIMLMHNNKDKYVATLASEYSTDAMLVLTDNWKKPLLKFQFIKLWPTSLAECQLSYRSGEQLLESSITFKYDRYEIV